MINASRVATFTCCQGWLFGLGLWVFCFSVGFFGIQGSAFITKIKQQKTVETKNISPNQQYLTQVRYVLIFQQHGNKLYIYLKRIPQDYLITLKSQIKTIYSYFCY